MTLPDVDTVDSYDGCKVNYGPVEDPTTDRDATLANRAYANVSMATRTGTRAWARFTTDDTTPTLTDSNAVWGNAVDLRPVVARTGTGVFTLTWPASVYDEIPSDLLGRQSHNVNFRMAKRPNVEGATLCHAQAEVTAANVVTVRTFNAAGSANDIAGTVIGVEVI